MSGGQVQITSNTTTTLKRKFTWWMQYCCSLCHLHLCNRFNFDKQMLCRLSDGLMHENLIVHFLHCSSKFLRRGGGGYLDSLYMIKLKLRPINKNYTRWAWKFLLYTELMQNIFSEEKKNKILVRCCFLCQMFLNCKNEMVTLWIYNGNF